MKAAVIVAPREPIEIHEVSLRNLDDKEVLVRTLAVGVCHSDVAPWEGGRAHVHMPVICGHELAGVVERVGSGVSRVKVGDRIVGSPWPYCGTCFYCVRGQAPFCESLGPGGAIRPKFSAADGSIVNSYALGAFAEQTVLSEFSVIPIHSELPPEQLSLVGCAVLTGFGAVINVAKVRPGDIVAVLGCGGVGQMVIKAASIAGAGRIFAVDRVPLKLAAAKASGATDLVHTADGDIVDILRDATGSHGVDVAIEVVGNPQLLMSAHRATRNGGTVVAVGSLSEEPEFRMSPFEIVHGGGKRLLGCRMGGGNPIRDIQTFADLASAGQYDVGELISRTYRLEEIQQSFDNLLAGEVIRTVITF